MSGAIDTWREADACLSELLVHPESTWQDRIDRLEISEEVRDCLQRLVQASSGTGPLDGEVALAPDSGDFDVDQLIGQSFGPWQLTEAIGRGGMAVVYEARRSEVEFDQIAALKLLPRGSAGHDQFRREQSLLAQLEHPFIARFLDAGVSEDGTPWIAMERVVGTSLDRVTEGWDSAAIVKLMRRIIEAVAFAHRHLVIHRDLKPGNVLVDEDGRPRLLDFGIAKLISTEKLDSATRLFTPEYAAPEQFTGKAVSTATDVYGLGAILHRLLVGQAPRHRSGEEAIDLNKIDDADLRAIVEKALRDDPSRRYKTAEALDADLGRWQRREPVLARPDSRRYRLQRWLYRNRAAAVASALVMLAIVLGAVGVAWQAHQTATQSRMVASQNDVLTELLASPQRTASGRQVSMADVLDNALSIIDQRMPDPSMQRVFLLSQLGLTQESLGQPHSALVLWQRTVSDLQQVAPDDHRRRIQARLGVARSMIAVEQYLEAQALLDSLHATAPEYLAIDDEVLALIAVHRYRASSQQGVVATADLIDELLQAGAAVSWQRDLAQGTYRCQRLNALMDRGRFAEVVDESSDFLSWAESIWGTRNGHTLCALEASVVALSRTGRLDEAEPVARRVLSVAEDWLGDSDVVTFTSRNSLANVLQELGRTEEAIALHQMQLDQLDQVQGLTAAHRALPFRGLSVALLEAGRYDEAEPIAREVVIQTRALSGAETPASYVAQANLAELLIFDGRAQDALEPIETAFQGLGETLGADHPVTVFARGIRGGARIAVGNVDGALSDLEDAPSQLTAAFGEDDVNVMNCRYWLAQALAAAGRAEEARSHAETAYLWYLEHKGGSHPRTLANAELFESLNAD